MAFWQGVQLNFFRSEVGESAGKFSSLVAKFFTPMLLKWEHWWCLSALSEKFYCSKFILDIIWVKIKLKQGHHCFSQKQTGSGQRGLQCPRVLSVPLTFKCKLSLSSQCCPSAREGEEPGSLLRFLWCRVLERAWRRLKDGSNCSFTLFPDILHPEEKILPCREHKSRAAFSF